MSFSPVKAKKHLGQHFLKDQNIANKIVDSLSDNQQNVLEIGPGTGILTKLLLERDNLNFKAIDIDRESVAYLKSAFPDSADKFMLADFLRENLDGLFHDQHFSVIGNFPYNISSQILFKVIDHRQHIPEVVGMFQKEVAERICTGPGNKSYGIISVLLQAYFDVSYLFTVNEQVFSPPPKVKSAVIRLTRRPVIELSCDEIHFKKVVKMAFNQRRKTLKNSLKAILADVDTSLPIFLQRPEQLSVNQFIELTNLLKFD